jgi:hypothetical protein
MQRWFLLLFGPALAVAVFVKLFEVGTLSCDRTLDRCTLTRSRPFAAPEVRSFPANDLQGASLRDVPHRKGANLDQRIELILRPGESIVFSSPVDFRTAELRRKAGLIYDYAHTPTLQRLEVTYDNRATVATVCLVLLAIQAVIATVQLRAGRRRHDRR